MAERIEKLLSEQTAICMQKKHGGEGAQPNNTFPPSIPKA